MKDAYALAGAEGRFASRLLWQKEGGHLLSFGVLTMRTHCSAASAVSAQRSSLGSSLKSLCHALQSLSLAATAPGSSTLRL